MKDWKTEKGKGKENEGRGKPKEPRLNYVVLCMKFWSVFPSRSIQEAVEKLYCRRQFKICQNKILISLGTTFSFQWQSFDEYRSFDLCSASLLCFHVQLFTTSPGISTSTLNSLIQRNIEMSPVPFHIFFIGVFRLRLEARNCSSSSLIRSCS